METLVPIVATNSNTVEVPLFLPTGGKSHNIVPKPWQVELTHPHILVPWPKDVEIIDHPE